MYRSTCAHLSFFFKAISAQMLLRPARSTWVHCVRSVQGYLYHLLWHEFIVFTVYLATCATCFDKSSLCTLCTGLPVPPASTRVHYVRCVQGYLCHLLRQEFIMYAVYRATCATCFKSIPAGSVAVVAPKLPQNLYHPACFVCRHCQVHIQIYSSQ
jgi:hypothetical protein